jgi:ubiquinone/menaquinone biosynthesis C-methylase UbiE
MFDAKTHWEKVYQQKSATEVSWYQASPALSLALIGAAGAGRDARVVDVGGGASRLVDHLVETGYRHMTVLDIAGSALQQARRRLGDRAGQVTWLEQDVSAGLSRHRFDIWHDRAVFHFLTDPVDRSR